MKKKIAGIIVTAGLLLFASCGPKEDIKPVGPTGSVATPTTTEAPTCTPKVTEAGDITSVPEPSKTPVPDISVIPSPVLKPTVKPEPTETPTPVLTEPAETPEPTAEPTEIPEPRETPVPTQVPVATPTMIPTPSPTPAINPETLVNYGWQKTVSIDGKYMIVFPDRFRESSVTKDGKELYVKYTCTEEAGTEFQIAYLMQQTLEEVENAILGAGGTILEGSLGEKRVVLEWQQDGKMYRGILSEEQYSQTLLGSTFEEEWITGVMQVTLAYPADRRMEFETADFNYYIKQNREE